MHTLPKVSPAMLDGLLWFYETGNWNEVRTGTSAALVGRNLVGHTKIGRNPDLIKDDGVAVLLANGRLRHEAGDTVREARSGNIGTVTEVHPTYIVTTIGQGGPAAYLPVSKLPAVWATTGDSEPAEDTQDTSDSGASDSGATAEVPRARELNGLEALHTDRALIGLMLSVPGENVRRKRAELLLQLPTPAARIQAVEQAHHASTQLGGPDLVVALADVVAIHPDWRPVSCGGRYLPCPFSDGSGEWGVYDTDESRRHEDAWVEIGGAGVARWSSFAYAAENAVSMSGLAAQVLAQKPWDMSVVRPGDRIEGKDVSVGGRVQGTVVGVVGPVRSPDCGGYRYLVRTETGRRHIVFAERWV